MKTLKLTDEQFETLENMFNAEWQQEIMFQSEGDHDTEWLEKYLELYKAIVKSEFSNTKSFIDAMVVKELIELKEQEIREIKNETQNN